MIASADESQKLIPRLKAFFSPINTQFKKDLEGYKISHLYGMFISLVFLLSFAVGILSVYTPKSISDPISLGIGIAIFGLIGGMVLFLLFVYVFIHIYTAFLKRSESLEYTLRWQIIAMAISIILTFIMGSTNYIYGGFVISFILLFVYPIWALTAQPTESNVIKNTLDKIYSLITLLIYIIQFVIQFKHL